MTKQALIQQLLDELTAGSADYGLQVAAYLNGKPVINAHSGTADSLSGKPVDKDTLFLCKRSNRDGYLFARSERHACL